MEPDWTLASGRVCVLAGWLSRFVLLLLCSHCSAADQLRVGQFGGFPRCLVFSAGLVLGRLVTAFVLLVVDAPARTQRVVTDR